MLVESHNKQQLFGSALLWTRGLLGASEDGWRGTAWCVSIHRALPACPPSPWLRTRCGFTPWSAGREPGCCVTHREVPEGEFSLGEAASAPQLNVQLPESPSEPRALGPSRETLKGRSSPALGHLQSQFRVLLNFPSISVVSLGLRWQIN